MVARITQIARSTKARTHRLALTNEFQTRPTPLKLRNEPEEFFNPVKRPKDPNERKPKRPQPSVPHFKCLSD